STELKPGEYEFRKNASLRDVIGTIVEGKVVQHSVTIPEGLTSEQIVARLSDNDIFSGAVREMPREGTLLPETYKFPRGTTRFCDCCMRWITCSRKSGSGAIPTSRSRRRNNW